MSPADGIRKLGFRRWYERQLIESHAYFITCFLCMILVIACMEGFSLQDYDAVTLIKAIAIPGAGMLGVLALRRYQRLLARAEHIAEHSTCPRCAAYGRIAVLASADAVEPASAPPWMRVQCRKCGQQWLIE